MGGSGGVNFGKSGTFYKTWLRGSFLPKVTFSQIWHFLTFGGVGFGLFEKSKLSLFCKFTLFWKWGSQKVARGGQNR